MKKYLITGLAAVAISGMFTSCTHDTDAGGSGNLGVVETYEQAFISRFGTPSADADWGFGNGATKAGTRALPTLPSNTFRDTNPITKPSKPEEIDDIEKPTSTKTFYDTRSAAKTAGAKTPDHDGNTFGDNDIIIIDEDYYKNGPNWYIYGPKLDNKTNLTVCIDGTVTLNVGTKDTGATICVLQNSTLNLAGISKKATIYLAPGATLNLTNYVTLEEGQIITSNRSTINVQQNLTLKSNASVVVNGGATINFGDSNNKKNLTIESSSIFWNEGTTNYLSEVYVNSNATLYCENNTTFSAKRINLDNGGVLYNSGNITLTEDLTTSNDNGIIYSTGSISARKLSINKLVKLWNEGDVTLTSEFSANQNGHEIYNKGTFTTTKIFINKETKFWNEGTVNDSGEMTFQNPDVHFYNAENKTLTVASINFVNNGQLLYNEGTVESAGSIQLRNVSAEIINNGNLTGASMYLDAGGKFHNEGTTVITGLTKVTNTNSWWANDGKYTSGSFEITGGSAKNVFNNCSLTVKATDTNDDGVADTDGVFFINEGGFILNGGASLVTDYVTWTNKSNVWMGSKALMLVKETFLTNNYDTECGIHGEGNEYAVVKAKSITHNGNDQSRMNYYGKLYIDADYHFPQWYKDASSNKQPAYYHEDKVKFSFTDEKDPNVKKEDSPVVIEKDDEKGCTPGYNTTGGGGTTGGGETGGGETGGGDDETTPSIRVIAEDMGDQSLKEASDFDFNDVVFDVTWVSDSEVDVEILAAGGTLPLTIGWNGNETNESGYIDYEVHNLLGYSETMIINTHSSVGNHIDGVPSKHLTLNGTFRKDHFAEDVRDNIPVKVRKNNRWYEIKADQGKVAGKLAVDKEYDPWCNERKDIDDWWQNADKKGLFSKYTQDPTTLTKYWYKQAKFRQLKPGEYIELK
jgi:hypothetical protein